MLKEKTLAVQFLHSWGTHDINMWFFHLAFCMYRYLISTWNSGSMMGLNLNQSGFRWRKLSVDKKICSIVQCGSFHPNRRCIHFDITFVQKVNNELIEQVHFTVKYCIADFLESSCNCGTAIRLFQWMNRSQIIYRIILGMDWTLSILEKVSKTLKMVHKNIK